MLELRCWRKMKKILKNETYRAQILKFFDSVSKKLLADLLRITKSLKTPYLSHSKAKVAEAKNKQMFLS